MDASSTPQGQAGPGAGHTTSKPIIAVFNASNDTVELLRTALETQGFHTVVGHIPDVKSGELDLVAFIEHHPRRHRVRHFPAVRRELDLPATRPEPGAGEGTTVRHHH